MPTANEQILDADIAHQIDLHKYSNNVVRRIIAILNRTDMDLFVQLQFALDGMTPENFSVDRLESLLQSVRAINATAYRQLGDELAAEMRDLTDYEAGYQLQLFRSVLPVQIVLDTVSVDATYAAAMSRPFQGRLLREWSQSIEAGRMARIRDTVRMSYLEGMTTGDIVRRVRGTRARKYEDGIIEIDRRHAESVVRTAVSHTAGTARDQFYERNSDIIKSLQWTATLDSRTTLEFCVPRDGKQYHPKTHAPIGHDLPWGGGPGRIHWCCRSASVPVLKSWKEMSGVDGIEEFSPSTRASLSGQVPAGTTYVEWLKRQSTEKQDDVMGPTRGALFRKGGLSVDRFFNDKGRFLTLKEMAERDAKAFAKAGVTP